MWKLESNERVAHWRDFRRSLDLMSLPEAVQATANFWQSCPYAPYYLDPDRPQDWPSPWQLIAENYYCDLAKSLGMLYTMYFTCHQNELNARICVYHDPASHHTYNLVDLCQGKYMLNFLDQGSVNTESINKNFKLKQVYTSTDLKLDTY